MLDISAKIEMIGKTYGHLTVISELPHEKGKPIYYLCQCDCGNPILHKACGSEIRRGNVRSCGCQSFQQGKKLNDLIGKRFGKLVALEVVQQIGTTKWKCQCDCGNIIYVKRGNLLSGNTTSCGCNRSKGEAIINNILLENNINYKRELSFSDLLGINKHPLRFDFAIFDNDNNLIKLIEYNGEQHYNKNNNFYSEQLHQADIKKQEYCKNKNIKLQIISYIDLDKINTDLILGDIIIDNKKEQTLFIKDLKYSKNIRSFTREQLIRDIGSSNFEVAARKYNISSNGLRYWCKVYNLPVHTKEIKKIYQIEMREPS